MTSVSAVRLDSPLGSLAIRATAAGVCAVEFLDDAQTPAECRADAGSWEVATRAAAELTEYFAGRLSAFTVPVAQPGTEFQRAVWAELAKIPIGQTRSYHDVARALGQPRAARAVGAANGRNQVAVIVPCHRVIASGGGLGGYGCGLWRKQWLLDLERR
jgi:O-6-methylguanine DNA methyltransferase